MRQNTPLRAERSFEFIKQTEGNWVFLSLFPNFLNLFTIDPKGYKNFKTSTIAGSAILKN
jgi:hypothetical protein